jgi:hypothetical protein
MKVRYSDERRFRRGYSIFLAGPTPRSERVQSWRKQALEILDRLGFKGTVLVPERRDWRVKFAYTDQTEWEYSGLNAATVVVFWVPRKLRTMPAFTTNVEFGFWMAQAPNKVVYGRPNGAAKTEYLDWMHKKFSSRAPLTTLEQTLAAAVEQAERLKGTHRGALAQR